MLAAVRGCALGTVLFPLGVWLVWAMSGGAGDEIVLEYEKETREWVNRHFPRDPHEPVS